MHLECNNLPDDKYIFTLRRFAASLVRSSLTASWLTSPHLPPKRLHIDAQSAVPNTDYIYLSIELPNVKASAKNGD